jgi:hypothetical protein
VLLVNWHRKHYPGATGYRNIVTIESNNQPYTGANTVIDIAITTNGPGGGCHQ